MAMVLVSELVDWLIAQRRAVEQECADRKREGDVNLADCADCKAVAYQNVINKLMKGEK